MPGGFGGPRDVVLPETVAAPQIRGESSLALLRGGNLLWALQRRAAPQTPWVSLAAECSIENETRRQFDRFVLDCLTR